jgi:hypothetical protein
MNKNKKIALIVGVMVIVIGAAVVVGRSDLFQGNLTRVAQFNQMKPINLAGLYKNGQFPPKVVSAVTSAVPSVVVSNVTSKLGTSKVASVVTSPVASAVPVSAALAAKVDASTLPLITGNVLKTEAKKFFLSNPAKFQLSPASKKRIIDLYKIKYRMK